MRRTLLLFGALAVSAIAAGIAFGAIPGIPGADGTISACFDKQSGQLRIYNAEGALPKSCGSKEEAISWNQEGIRGAEGPQGPAGLAGPTSLTNFRPDGDPTGIPDEFTTYVSREIGSAEAGLNLAMATVHLKDSRPAGDFVVSARLAALCQIGGVSDSRVTAFIDSPGGTAHITLLWRGTVDEGETVAVRCRLPGAGDGSNSEVFVGFASLMLVHVNS